MTRRTPLYAAHAQSGGKLVDFAGWDLPVHFSGVIAEHLAVRSDAGLFDVSHMGEIFISGPRALAAVQGLLTNDAARIADGQAYYAGLLDESGGFIDDVITYRFGSERFMLCVNASNRTKDADWIRAHSFGATVEDRSDDYAQLALQGPKSSAILGRLTKIDLSRILPYHFQEGEVAGAACIVARTGYTGEDGFELYCSPEKALSLWAALMESGKPSGLLPCGLGARDSLRLEMKYALYGNDIDAEHTPFEASLAWIVKMDKGDFLGRAALEKQKREGVARKLIGFTTSDRSIPRHGYPLFKDGERIGVVTSGTQSPSLKKPIAMGYVPASLSAAGSTFDVEVRGRRVPAVVVKTPFYQPPGLST